jgi:prepilin-type N-terminal cleavage/methylation domain-containing protein
VRGRATVSARHIVKGIFKRRDQGFTLVELLVVIAIIGVLATLVLLQLGTARARARDTQRISHVNQLRTAVEQYYEDNGGVYPATLDDVAPRYIQSVPQDPLRAEDYGFAKDDATDEYHIWSCLENNAAALNNDIDIDSSGFGGEDHSNEASTEACTDTANCGDCYYDTGIATN